MKKVTLIFILAVSVVFSATGQTIDEALKYSQLFYGGTARFQAMGGAFTALGGDLSVLSQNPAGLAVFRSTEISLTPQMFYNNSSSTFGESTYDNLYKFNLNQIGIVAPLISNSGEGLKSFNIGYSFNRTNNFNSNAIIKGVNNNSSMADYWADSAYDRYFTDITGAEGIAFEAWIIDTITGSGGYEYGTVFSAYGDSANSTYGQTVRRIISNEGYSGEHAFSAAVNYNDKVYIGATIGINRIKAYTRYEHLEADYDNVIPDFDNFTYTDVVETDGTGFSFKLGVIMKPVDMLRLGFSFHSPVIYRLHEYFYDSVNSGFDDGYTYDANNDPYRFEYTLTSPLRLNAGAAVQIGKKGLISADYEFVDYKMARFSRASDDYNYFYENQDVKDIYDVAHNIRLGAELRITSGFYLRGGYALYGSAFAKGEDNEGNSYNQFSGGLGMRQSNFFFDLSYALMSNTQKYFMYNHPDLDAADISYNRSLISATLGFRF
ncbi:MAG TPA: outer membrane protein transport protein [Bacteroidales bacterium]|nr:outer membrane protein transport protein [Bacteroidales bacterium]